MAAKTAGMKEVLVPARNKKDVNELEEEIVSGLTITYVSEMCEVTERAFGGKVEKASPVPD